MIRLRYDGQEFKLWHLNRSAVSEDHGNKEKLLSKNICAGDNVDLVDLVVECCAM